MKIYIEDINNIHDKIDFLNKTYKTEKIESIFLHISDGIYECFNNKIYKYEYDINNYIENIIINDTNIVIDYSKITSHLTNHIPFNKKDNITLNKIKHIYSEKKSLFNFVILCEIIYINNNEIYVPYDYYFECKSYDTEGCNNLINELKNDIFIDNILNTLK
jgi:hypothetical protein